MTDVDSLNVTISTLLTKLTLKKQRDKNSRTLIREMKEIAISAHDDYDAFVKQCDQTLAHFDQVEQERHNFENRLKKELARLYQANQLKQKGLQKLTAVMGFDVK